MAKNDWRTRLNTKWRERVFLAAARRLAGPRPMVPNLGTLVASVVAVSIFLATSVFASLGVYLVVFDFPNIAAGIMGMLFLAAAYATRPRVSSANLGQPRETFPELVRTLDQISEALGTPKVTTIELVADWDSSIQRSTIRREVHLKLGMPLFIAASGTSRTAILAHELAHLVNGDPQRSTLLFAARHTVSEWLRLFNYDEIVPTVHREAALGEVLRRTIAAMLFGLRALMDRGNFYTSQIAEYVADGLGTKVAGKAAMREALHLSSTAFYLDRLLKSFIPCSQKRGTETLQFLRRAVQMLPQEFYEERDNMIYRGLMRNDVFHPPTAYRIAFLQTLGPMEGSIEIDHATWDEIDRELEPFLEPLGSAILSSRTVNAPNQ